MGVKTNCEECFHKKACSAWIRHCMTLYDDFLYSTDGCPDFIRATVVRVVTDTNVGHRLIIKED